MKIEGVELIDEHVGVKVGHVSCLGNHVVGTIERWDDNNVFVMYRANLVYAEYAENLMWIK